MKLSEFGEKFAGQSGIVELMDDLGAALNENPDMIFMGGGNPAHLPEVESVFEQRLQAIMADPQQRHSLLGIYQSPQGEKSFRESLASFLRKQFDWAISAENIAVSNGSQSAFFVLFNMFAGTMTDGSHRHIHLPLAPEYLGYADSGLTQELFSATRPTIELLDNNQFKYHVDFANLNLSDDVGAMCVSRPTNPTGNVLTNDEIEHLDQLAQKHDIPLIIDGAYGLPFPSIIFNDVKPHWNSNTILALSLSKLGLPGARTGIIIARENIIQAYTNANTILSLACGNLGPAIAKSLFDDGEIVRLSQNHVAPFYRERAQQTVQWFNQALKDVPYRIHKPEGAIFLWLWFEGLPITSQELYERLKRRGVLIVPGHNFFVGINDDWAHKHECIRVSYAQDSDTVQQGVQIIAEEVCKAYSEA
ncbi:valine--pyruvate transaminase [Maricurvus nonylphenolicus]|uniref:valine--pyruvate transaminase n=1 Tax=Maricurvus nonylphenolicus TaxID=1008307 RepID=UPI0036F1BAD6